jgi:hypothetical protein
MPAQRLAMRHVTEVLRLKWSQGLSDRKIAQSLGISRPTVAEYVRRAQAAGCRGSCPAPSTRRPWSGCYFPPTRPSPARRVPSLIGARCMMS